MYTMLINPKNNIRTQENKPLGKIKTVFSRQVIIACQHYSLSFTIYHSKKSAHLTFVY